MEDVLFSRLSTTLAFNRGELGMSRAVLPEVNDIITCNNDMSFVHFGVFRFDRDSLAIDRASNSVAENKEPLVNSSVVSVLGNQNAVFTTSDNFLESVHVFDMSLVNAGIPEYNAHIVALRLAESKD